ncbi:hypothetical protein IDSA_01160 [Pseudidiomarina salinarum]|uniref:Glycosyl transferase family 1 domain-containing protein n=1 Tax=Pseudidiomarina salinarum TaxID=435908 RepID=A0A094IUM9_9GAMM|nr:hypothetical protein [Pseudidiomarina salinarum]KFZ31365.1 hypothetical protein IDSA_01160 [Pseudidiomarina salinarum]RUO70876.1 hypothetical protein CWI79_05405 [Pseudidiomarina salinarum]
MGDNVEVVYFPKDSGANKYVAINKSIISSLERFYMDDDVGLRDFFNVTLLLKRRFNKTVVIVNWLENLIKSRSGKLSMLGVFKYFLAIFVIKIHGARLVYVRHNFYPHGMRHRSSKLAQRLTNFGQWFADRKVSLSPHLKSSGYFYLPHPLYNNCAPSEYGENELDYYVIFGRIERYKNIDRVIKEWASPNRLIIAGSSDDGAYLSEIKALTDGKNIRVISNNLSDLEAAQLVKYSSGLIISHSHPNTIVSGSFFFGASCGVRIFALETDFFRFLVDKNSYQGLVLASSIIEISNEIVRIERSEAKIDHNQLYDEAALHFGDSKVASSWSEILTF